MTLQPGIETSSKGMFFLVYGNRNHKNCYMSDIVFWTSRTEGDFTVGTHFCPQKTQEETPDFLGVGFSRPWIRV